MPGKMDWRKDAGKRRVDANRRYADPDNPVNRVTWFFNETEEDRKYLYESVKRVWKKDRALCMKHYNPQGRSRYDRYIRSLLEEENQG